jgi:hypothetical protein
MEQEVKLEEARRTVSAMVRRAAEDGKREVMAFRFPSEWCTDKGRAINNFEVPLARDADRLRQAGLRVL